MIMRIQNRLIRDFKEQTKTTIWKLLNAMSVNYTVYSTHLRGSCPQLTGYDTYVYADSGAVVVVCLDCCGHCDEQTYEESEVIGPLIFQKGCEPRDSVVWKLSEAIKAIKEKLQDGHPDVNVYGVLMTEAVILNAYDLEDMWEARNIKVLDSFRGLKHWSIKVNRDDELAGKEYVDAILGTKPKLKAGNIWDWTVDDEDDDGQKEEDEENLSDNIEDESDESEDETELEPDDTFFPSGVIEQNLNLKVEVEILRPFPNPREELDRLIGCADIKRHMDELVALASYNKMMHEMFPGSRQHEVSLHSVFFGRPGTGKTTVCKIFGSLLRQAGALSKGHVVVCDRGTFIGTLWGDEERAVRQAVEIARGGVLMIDEAYLLNGKHQNDPGRIVIQMLMNILADETQRDIAVVLCGYKEPMQKLLDSNPGLHSRFPNKFEFCDFTVDELLEITKFRVNDFDYQFNSLAWEKYRNMLTLAYQARNPETWGNARFVANQLERIYIQHAARCVRQQPADKLNWRIITPEDIVPIEVPRPKARIGFG